MKIQKISFQKAHVRAFLEDIERPTYSKKLEAGSFQIVDIEVNHLLKSDENDLRGPVWYYQNLEDKLLRGSCSGVFWGTYKGLHVQKNWEWNVFK